MATLCRDRTTSGHTRMSSRTLVHTTLASRSRGPPTLRYCCKSLSGVANENSWSRWCAFRVATWGTTSFHLKSITEIRTP